MLKRLKETIRFEKQNMPDYQYRFNYRFLFPLIFVFIIGPIIAASISISMGIANSKYYLLPVIIWAVILFSMLLILIPYGNSVAKRVIEDKVIETKKTLVMIDFDLAMRTLSDKKICNETGFYTVDENIIPFDELKYLFVGQYWGGKTFLSLVIHSDRNPNDTLLEIDSNVFALIEFKKFNIVNVKMYSFLIDDTKEFMKKLIKRGSTMRFKSNDFL